jgi:glycosyltransferase involved in cell wall biosynthesis
MPIKKLDLFMPPLSQYGVLHHFTKKLFEALVRTKVDCKLLEAKRDNPKPFLEALFKDLPECTLSFNGLLPDDEGRFFCDMIRIPHLACVVDSPNHFVSLTKSPLSIVACTDRFSCDFFQGLGFQNVFFLPHGVERELAPDYQGKRDYDVVMLTSCIDYEGIRSAWKGMYPAALCKVMEEAAEIVLSDHETPCYQAFVQALERYVSRGESGIDPGKIDFITVLDEIEVYIKGKDRVELLKAIKDAKVDVFGSADGLGWKKYLGNKHPNIKIHDPVPYEQVLEIMKHSKIVLNSSPWIKGGTHERILAGLACGALVITNENIYMREHFKDAENIVFYQPQKRDKANHRVNEYLENSTKRQQVASKGRQTVMDGHTWDHRAAALLKELSPILQRIRVE